MTPFKPAEIRVIVFLSLLVLIGSALTMLKRQDKLSALDLGIFTDNSYYNYAYESSPPSSATKKTDSGSDSPSVSIKENDPDIEKVDLNFSGYYDLQALPGVGPVTAGKIIAYRDSMGRFRSIEELLRIRGIGPDKLAKIKDMVIIR